jgi:hypothetical protein
MFRFSIRELLLITAVVALVVGWWVEHRRANSASVEAARVAEKASSEEITRQLVLVRIQQNLKLFDLEIRWPRDHSPSVVHITGLE